MVPQNSVSTLSTGRPTDRPTEPPHYPADPLSLSCANPTPCQPAPVQNDLRNVLRRLHAFAFVARTSLQVSSVNIGHWIVSLKQSQKSRRHVIFSVQRPSVRMTIFKVGDDYTYRLHCGPTKRFHRMIEPYVSKHHSPEHPRCQTCTQLAPCTVQSCPPCKRCDTVQRG